MNMNSRELGLSWIIHIFMYHEFRAARRNRACRSRAERSSFLLVLLVGSPLRQCASQDNTQNPGQALHGDPWPGSARPIPAPQVGLVGTCVPGARYLGRPSLACSPSAALPKDAVLPYPVSPASRAPAHSPAGHGLRGGCLPGFPARACAEVRRAQCV